MNKQIITLSDAKHQINIEKEFNPTVKYDGRVLLFLDFDGVLHSFSSFYTKKKLFEKLPLLIKILTELSNVQVVISSAWAKKRTLSELRSIFPEKYRNRIVGAIHRQSEYRFMDVKNYLKERGETCPWIAVDDMAEYEPTDPIVWTDYATGLTPDTAKVLLNALTSPEEFLKFRETNHV